MLYTVFRAHYRKNWITQIQYFKQSTCLKVSLLFHHVTSQSVLEAVILKIRRRIIEILWVYSEPSEHLVLILNSAAIFFIVATVWECRNSCGVCPALIINYYLPSLGSSSEVMTRVSSMVLVVLVVGVVLVWLLALLLYSQHIGRLRSSFKAQTLFTSGLRWSGLRYPFRQSNLNVHYMHYRFTSTLFNFIH